MARTNTARRRKPDPVDDSDPIMTAADVAKMLECGERYVRTLCQRGRARSHGRKTKGPFLVASRLGRAWKIRKSEVYKMLGRDERGEH